MSSRRTALVVAAILGVLVVLAGHSPLYLPLVALGALLPDVDALNERVHRSWALHTFLLPALAYQALVRLGVASPALVAIVHFVTVGMAAHFACDYVYPKEIDHAGARWPVRPHPGEYWGLVLLGVSWAVQWFFYLTDGFFPWLVGLY